ncbi:RelA/SpoT domain-containing protein [Microbacterium sp. P26]|uniref:RelA/SpoT domain-containing protein n=1 Tax=Microbacterium TaxID=33882 RepID=UPI00203C0B57|nr:RelA/SpoT domain-containing protein [Microbacterium sp. P26]MCM3500613.1 RelA/SpoT domain-containing protein [Microbacterium sp. P26]
MARAHEPLSYSKGEINRCGDFLVDLYRTLEADDNERLDAIFDRERWSHSNRVVDAFRTAHARPLNITSVGLRQFVGTALGDVPVVSQRLKRLPRIIRKLANANGSDLARLEDIGGTRAIVPNLVDQERLCAHIEKRWGGVTKRRRDYVADPKSSGYRARHIVVERHDRRIEIQVRTINQQRWANMIEEADSRFKMTLKDGVGPQSMLDYFSAAGDMLYHQETGSPPPSDLRDRYTTAADAVVEAGYFARPRSR